MERQQISLSFVNTLESPDFPQTSLIIDVTDLVVHTVVRGGYARQAAMTVAQIQNLLNGMFGPLEWNEQPDPYLRATKLYGRRDLMNHRG